MKIIFMVDDKQENQEAAKRTLEGQYEIYGLLSAEEMFVVINDVVPNLILLDVDMPDMDGLTALTQLKKNETTAAIPVILLSRERNVDLEATGFEFGAVDFITKPLSPSVLLNRVAHQIKIDELLKKRTARLERLQNGILDVVVDMVESRDKINNGHVDRTSKFLRVLIDQMKINNVYAEELNTWDIETVISSSRLHDIGKIAVSDVILNKPGRLTDEEFTQMRTHAKEGEHIIDIIIEKTGDEPYLHHAKQFAGYHHERWDGSGYPHALQYEAIPLEGRIMAIADVYDALVTPRPYKMPMSHEEALYTIREDAGRHFDPAIIDIFCEVADKFNEIAMM